MLEKLVEKGTLERRLEGGREGACGCLLKSALGGADSQHKVTMAGACLGFPETAGSQCGCSRV